MPRYITKYLDPPEVVTAIQIQSDFKLEKSLKTEKGFAGDYIMTDNYGIQHVFNKHFFEENYEGYPTKFTENEWQQGFSEMNHMNQEEDDEYIKGTMEITKGIQKSYE